MRVSFKAWRYLMLLAATAGFAACTSSGTSGGASSTGGSVGLDAADPGPYRITIEDLVYMPTNLEIPAGETLWVVNKDVEPHSVTSESKPGDFVPGAVNGVQFDTGIVSVNASASILVSATATPGTVVPYFCTVHKSSMGEGSLTIQ